MTNGCAIWPDTPTYIKSAEILKNGHIDVLRTPIYPLILAICEQSLQLVIVLQIIIFYVSVICFYITLRRTNLASNIIYFATVLYCVCPMSLLSNCSVITESLSSSFCVFEVFFFVKWSKNHTWMNLLGLLMCTLFLTFLRPSFIYLSIALLIMSVIHFIKLDYKYGTQLLSVVGVVLALLFCYCKQIESKTGVFATSSVQCKNEYIIAYNIGMLTSENVTDPTIRQRVFEFEKKNDRENVFDVPKTGDLPLQQRVDEIQRIKSIDIVGWYIKTFLDNIRRSWIDNMPFGYNCIDFSIVYFLLFLTGVYLVATWFCKCTSPVVTMFLWLMCVGNIMVNLLGSFAEWTRLFLPSFPILIMLITLMFGHFKFKIEYSSKYQLP